MTKTKKEVKPKKVKVKSHVRKITPSKKTKTTRKKKTTRKTASEKKIDNAIIDNFVMIQKVMVNLSTKLDSLSTQISKLLELFEITAKSFAEKDFKKQEDEETKEVLKKLDNISQQAGLIGKGLALIHEISSEVKEKKGGEYIPKPIIQNQNMPPQRNQNLPGYSPSGKDMHINRQMHIETPEETTHSNQN